MTAFTFAPLSLCLDLETAFDDASKILKFAAWRSDTNASLSLAGQEIAGAIAEINALTAGAVFVLGHNIRRHDLPSLAQNYPDLDLLKLPLVDTLELAPIAFPANPYHPLLKDYKPIRDSRNDPLKDARLSLALWQAEYHALAKRATDVPDELLCYHYLLAKEQRAGLGSFFTRVRRAVLPHKRDVVAAIGRLCNDKVCPRQLYATLPKIMLEPAIGQAFAYVLAWLQVSGGNSILPPWVSLNYPATRELIQQLRETDCQSPDCFYCQNYLQPKQELRRYFAWHDFRPEPQTAEGESLQAAIIDAAYAEKNLLGILPTGGGKSLCYQLPALSRHWRSGKLTIVISPLQSLMKDQVDQLLRQGLRQAASLNGLLSLPERRDVLERIRAGDIGLLFVSPEQFRNRRFIQAIRLREVAAWVFDEAHCLSKWGNDFRPDYLYVARFIRDYHLQHAHGLAFAPIHCFTATAKHDVVHDITEHFRDVLGVKLEIFDGGHVRTNLHYEVHAVHGQNKLLVIKAILQSTFQSAQAMAGGAIIFVAKRQHAEELATALQQQKWACAYFHAGLDAAEKKQIQDDFLGGMLQIIVATNAFGMGVDKPNVRLVIHADIPSSLENYLQEAGRAGRDREEARCVLLYDENDVEAQFRQVARHRLARQEITQILRTLRRHAAHTPDGTVVLTTREILASDEVSLGVDNTASDAEGKVRMALAWLERAKLISRGENQARLFPASLKINALSEADPILLAADLSWERREHYRQVLHFLLNSPNDEGISTDDLMHELALPAADIVHILCQLEQLDLLSNDIELGVLLRRGVKDPSSERLQRLFACEHALLDLLCELLPEAYGTEWQSLNLRGICQEMKLRTHVELLPNHVLQLLHSLALPFGETGAGAGVGVGIGDRSPLLQIHVIRREILQLRTLHVWEKIREISMRRQQIATVLLQSLLRKIEPGVRGVKLRVNCRLGDLSDALRNDPVLGQRFHGEKMARAIDAGLLYLHDNDVLILDRGKSIFRSAMTLQVKREEKRGFTVADFEPLKQHYQEKTLQIHVVHEYARLALGNLEKALGFVHAYFILQKNDFLRRYFPGQRDMLERATTQESWQRIVESLQHPLQEELVTARSDTNRLVLAGPGSGKTRVIVHRVAWLVRVQREPATSLIVLTFNRHAAWEIRKRLFALIGSEAFAVTVLTYHSLALRLTGSSLTYLVENPDRSDFTRPPSAQFDRLQARLDMVLEQAVALLEGTADAIHPPSHSHNTANNLPPDSVQDENAELIRERLLAGYRYILVDEYQDIDEWQYRLIAGLVGRSQQDKEANLHLMAVGDDDQNIYAFRATSNTFIQRFQTDYHAKVDYLVENYRSSGHIIAAANAVIAQNSERLKAAHPVHINAARALQPPGGEWQLLDALGQGRVQILPTPADPCLQAMAVIKEIQRWQALDPNCRFDDVAILARTHKALRPLRAWCESQGIPFHLSGQAKNAPRLHQTKEIRQLLDLLHAKRQRALHPLALLRWFVRQNYAKNNPWARRLGDFIHELNLNWQQNRIPTSMVLDSLYEFSADTQYHQNEGALTLSTVHGAKGQEFRHVIILDTGDWQNNPAERRLYYVGMTRAQDTLLLCESMDSPNPFSPNLRGAAVRRRVAPALASTPWQALTRHYRFFGMGEVDLDFAGRHAAQHSIHQVLANLHYGYALTVSAGEHGIELRDPRSGLVVCCLAQACQLDLSHEQIISAHVEALVLRHKKDSRTGFRERCKAESWWVVLPTLVSQMVRPMVSPSPQARRFE